MALSINTVVEMSNGNLIEITEIKPWTDDDGAVYGRIGRNGRWLPRGYVGTIKGIEQARVKR